MKYLSLLLFLVACQPVLSKREHAKPRQCDILRENDTPLRGSICKRAPKGNMVFVELLLPGKQLIVHESRIIWLKDYRFYEDELEKELMKPYEP